MNFLCCCSINEVLMPRLNVLQYHKALAANLTSHKIGATWNNVNRQLMYCTGSYHQRYHEYLTMPGLSITTIIRLFHKILIQLIDFAQLNKPSPYDCSLFWSYSRLIGMFRLSPKFLHKKNHWARIISQLSACQNIYLIQRNVGLWHS